MANVTAKTSSNIFYKARCEAATHNEQLSSREGAADYMSIDRGRLYRIESGIAVPYPEEIRLMADLYNAPELENYFCRTMCPLGCEMPKAELANLDRITVRTLSVFRKIGKTKEKEVIFQKGQFSPISNGRYDEVEPDEDCYRALQLIQTGGWDESHGATYFESKSDSTWHSENLTFLFKHGKHYFYKE